VPNLSRMSQVAPLFRPHQGIGYHSLEPVTRKRSMKVMSISLAAAFVLGLSLAVGHAQDFAADVVYTAATKANASSAANRDIVRYSFEALR
jgi:hypothetical protein